MFFVGAAVLLFALGYAFFYQSGDLFIWTDEARLAVHPPSALIEKFSTEAMVLGTAGVVSFASGIVALIFALFLACERVTFTISHSKEFLDPRNAKT
ncbi:hypothetical protein HY091_01385 [Candidatus Kaiserbacteria bacterium]|nr:hypothetical protein [Candidatus Kaiserbacteria bacterium]